MADDVVRGLVAQRSAPIRVAVIGSSWISRAHCHALLSLNHIRPLTRPIQLVSLHARTPETVEALATEFGFQRWSTRWEDAVEADDVDVVAVLTTNHLHAPVVRAALAAGKAVFCEKPLALGADDAVELAVLAEQSGLTAACGFNYRYHPATMLLRELTLSGRLGDVRHFRAVYLQDWADQLSATRPNHSGAGSIGDYSHITDFLIELTGVPRSVTAEVRGFGLTDDDAFVATAVLAGGGLGTLEASRFALGHKGGQRIEVNGTRGSAWWDMDDPNRLHVFLREDEVEGLGGFRDIVVTEPGHPLMAGWWPPGHVLGWEHGFSNEWRDFLGAVIEGTPVPHRQASFRDGAIVEVVSDALQRAAAEGRRVTVDIPGVLA
ncbi:Gfo/Idh/MocA family protein [Microbacterium yannicii]|uniref:Gfo/Idh/MocA family protein n=1 Tax=Microbacterium yannicii TaxID=671622 RepID=UPI00178C7AF6|nr:Gfo/Idh/MocA family oxidoreductase [Microbacterium yannicii]